jgi:NAD-dependent dihydropyrimidine dehydrogenase PreA subunit
MIASDCINCGACEPECPNNAISQGDPIFVIDPKLCTECVGFHDYEACAAVCPVDVCVTDPNNIESEEVLIARARQLHPETDFGANLQSRFRKAAAAPSVAATPAPAGAAPASAPAPLAAAKPAAAPVAAKAPPRAVPPKPAPLKKEPRPKKTFPNELPVSFAAAQKEYESKTPAQSGWFRTAVILAQPAIGALPHGFKKQLEEAVRSPLFTAGGATAANIVHNAVLYPLGLAILGAVLAALRGDPGFLFSKDVNNWLLIGFLIASVEAMLRLKDGLFSAKPAEEMRFPPAHYGPLFVPVAEFFFKKYLGLVRELPIPVDGFYSEGFVDKLERERRYGNVYTVEDRGGAYLVRMQFPRWLPEIGITNRTQLPDEMPDYDYDLALKDSELIVKGRCVDESVRKISSSIGAFPPEFTATIPFQQRVASFAHQFEDKQLEVLLVKA